MSDLKVGDVVYLKSGGPAMTINGKASMGAEWACAWFLDGMNKTADFKPEALTKENPSPRNKPKAG
ncbi:MULTISPECIES: YodC family protein [Acinetobacter]|uniref:YodC family protein n=1 Tax=Acinetobacter TaxID=469 RepID=UPI002FD9A114